MSRKRRPSHSPASDPLTRRRLLQTSTVALVGATRVRRCFICTMCSTSGWMSGAGSVREAKSLLSAMRTITCLDSSTVRMRTVFLTISGNGWGSSDWDCTLTNAPDRVRAVCRDTTGNEQKRGEGKTETLDFLGFTHISGKDQNGSFALKRKTIGKQMRAKLFEIRQQLRRRMHDPIAQTGAWLRSVVQSYFNYHAVLGNIDSLCAFRYRLTRLWRRVLFSRSQRQNLNWAKTRKLADRWIPQPRVLHPYPRVRFGTIHPG